VAQTGVNLKHRFLRVSLFLPKAFQLVNAPNPSKENAYGQTEGEVCEEVGTASIGQDRRLADHSADSALTTKLEGEFVTCEKLANANRRRVTAISLARLAFGLLRRPAHHYQQIESDPIRHHSFSGFVSLSAPLPLPVDLPPRLRRARAVVSPFKDRLKVSNTEPLSLEEIQYSLSANIIGADRVRFLSVWTLIPGKTIALFYSPITRTTIAVPVETFSTSALRQRLRQSNEAYGIFDGPEAA
jgi:hypothetical protein